MKEWLLETVCGSIVLNLIADLIMWFVVVLASVVCWRSGQCKVLAQAKRFFGVDQHAQIQVYVSAHEDKETSTKSVITAEEFEATIELHRLWAVLF